jgi:hypothetical protein
MQLYGSINRDKKANYRVLQSVRGRCVIAEVIIPDTVGSFHTPYRSTISVFPRTRQLAC